MFTEDLLAQGILLTQLQLLILQLCLLQGQIHLIQGEVYLGQEGRHNHGY